MRIPSEKRRRRILEETFAAGIRHFDVARMYGLGRVEYEVGAFARGRREQLVLATKFGIELKQASGIVSAVQGIGRRALNMIPALRRAVRKRSQSFYAPKCFDVATARRSLEESLRALRTDYVDIFLLHEPELADVRDTAVWEYLQRAREMGMIRAWGVAGYPDQVRPICDNIPELAKVIQVPNDVVHRQLERFRDCTDSAFITFSPYSEVYDKIHALVAKDAQIIDGFMSAANIDLRRPGVLAKLLLGYCLHANPSGVTLFSSGRAGGVRESVSTWKDGFPAETIRAFDEVMAGILSDGSRMQNELRLN